MFLIAEQSASYYKPILPLKPFVIRSSITAQEKWVIYEHQFESPPGRDGEEPTIHARIRLRAVVKKLNGRTVMPEDVFDQCPELRAWIVESPKTEAATE